MLDFKDNSNLVLKAFQKFLGSKDSNDFTSQVGIWIIGYVMRKLRASEDEASLVFLKFWIDKSKLLEYLNTKGCKNLFGFLSCFSRNLLLNIRKSEQSLKTKEEFALSNEKDKLIQNSPNTKSLSKKKLRLTLNKISILNRIILCLRYGIKLSKIEKNFLLSFLNNTSKYQNLMHEFHSRMRDRKAKELHKLEKLNSYQWRLLYNEKNMESLILSRKKKLQTEVLQIEELFTFKELSHHLGISKYKIVQSCEYCLQFIAKDLSEDKQFTPSKSQ